MTVVPSLKRVLESGPLALNRPTRCRRVVSPSAANTGAAPAKAAAYPYAVDPTNGSTLFDKAPCSQNGSTVEAKGTAQADGSILVSRVERKRN